MQVRTVIAVTRGWSSQRLQHGWQEEHTFLGLRLPRALLSQHGTPSGGCGRPAHAALTAPLPLASPAAFPKRILVLSPHPDDDVISMGGALIRLIDQGHEVTDSGTSSWADYGCMQSALTGTGTTRSPGAFCRQGPAAQAQWAMPPALGSALS